MKLCGGAWLGCALIAVLLSSCTSTLPGSAAEFEQKFSDVTMSDEQTNALEDRIVDADEYRAGFQRFRDCLLEAGFEITVVGESNETIQYSVPNEAVDGGSEGRCYSVEFEQLDMHWQLSKEDTSYSTQVMRDCLTENGLTPAGTAEEIGEQLKASGIDMATCGL